MKILMVFPALYMGWNTHGKGFEQSAINHGLASLSAMIKNTGHEVELFDLRKFTDISDFHTKVSNANYNVALIGFLSVDKEHAEKAIYFLKEIHPEMPVIAGGVHLTFEEIEKFGKADCIVKGEGEKVIFDLLEMVRLKQKLPPIVFGEPVKNLDLLPFVDRNLFDQKFENNNPILPALPIPFYTINFSRGCAYRCSYCLESKRKLFKGHRVRSVENCIDEIMSFDPFPGSLMIHDDHFPTKESWIVEFIQTWLKRIKVKIPFWCQLRADWIIKFKDYIPYLEKIGMKWVSLGIEGSQRMLNFYNKKLTVEQIIEAAQILHDNKINIFGNYIVGSPTETSQDIDELESILQQIRPEWHSASTYTSYPGSIIYDYIKKNDLWVGDIEDRNSHYSVIRFPYERKIKNIDYDELFNITIPRLTKYKSEINE